MEQAPFTFGTIADGEDFTDRIEETKRLVTNFRNGTNTMLISPRRWGKSSLVRHAAGETVRKQKDIRFCFIDLFNVRTEADFYHTLSREVIKAIGMNWEEVKKEPGDILNLAESICRERNIQLVICIDEFQNVSFYDDPLAFQKTLRSFWQHHRQVSYCLYGSKRHMLMEFFASSSMPFYKFGDLFFLEKIAAEYWIPFIQKRFADTGKQISASLSEKIAFTMEHHPYYVQQFAQQTWLSSGKKCTAADFDLALDNMLRQHHFLFQREADQLTSTQLNFLSALIDGVTQFTSKKTIDQYRLGTSGNIKRIKNALENKEIIDTTASTPVIQDPLFHYWLQEVYFEK